jgi:CheY-like chemotaxis protein
VVITLDVLMPGLDGWGVLAALKADSELAEIPVIMLTILTDRNLGYALGASDYLTKPVDRERLVGLLERYLDHRRDGPVLVVDDDPAAREMLRRMLEGVGQNVVEAGDGQAALEQLAAQEPALILLDLVMPKMDGFEFVATLRQRPEWGAIPVVVITARTLTVEDHERLNGSVERVLQKGAAGQDDLLAEVCELVARYVREPTRAQR